MNTARRSEMMSRIVGLAICVALVGSMAACRCKADVPISSGPTAQFEPSAATSMPPGIVALPKPPTAVQRNETVQLLCGTVLPESTPLQQVWRTDASTGGVKALLRDGDWLWVVTPTDLIRLDLNTLECTRFGGKYIPLSDQGFLHASSLSLDPEGRLWLSSLGTLYRYDGQIWQSFVTESHVYNIAFDAEGNLWIKFFQGRSPAFFARYSGHEPPKNGVWRSDDVGKLPGSAENVCDDWFASDFSDHPFTFHSPAECRLLFDWCERFYSLPKPEGITSWDGRSPIAADSSDRFWMLAPQSAPASTPYALWSFDGTDWQALPWPYGFTSLLIVDEARGGVWVGTDEGLVFSDGRSLSRYLLSPDDAIPVGPWIDGVFTDANGRLWASSGGWFLFYDDADTKHPIDRWQWAEVDRSFSVFAIDDRGGLWAVSLRAAGYFDGETWTYYPSFKDNRCNPHHILADAEGGLWMSSIGCSLRRFDGNSWTEYDTGARRERLALGHGGEIYAMGWDDALRQFNGETWKTLLSASSYGASPDRSPWIEDLVVGPEGEVWIALGDTSDLLVYYRDGGWKKVRTPARGIVRTLLFDSLGRLWVGHDYGILRYDGRSWKSIVSEDWPVIVRDLAEDRYGRIWISRRGGRFYFYDPARE
jgi:ligand-binding sensor domain-containing protein